MACLSPSPSGQRLSELLEEKQEPFFLDLHLLEKGCSSSRLLDGYDTAFCWPAGPANDAAAVLRRLASKKNKTAAAAAKGGKKKTQQPTGILRLLLSKILHGKSAAASGRKLAALQFSDSFKMANHAAVTPSPCSVKLAGVVKEKEATECYYSDCDSDDEKQLSPVSVLEHPFESSPVHGKLSSSPSKNGAMVDVLRELLDAAYSPALLTQLLAKSDDLLKDTAAAADEDDDYYYGYRTSPKNRHSDDDAYWEAHRAELAGVSELVAAEVPNARLDAAADLLPEREEVGAGVEAAVFEALLQELVMDLGISRC